MENTAESRFWDRFIALVRREAIPNIAFDSRAMDALVLTLVAT